MNENHEIFYYKSPNKILFLGLFLLFISLFVLIIEHRNIFYIILGIITLLVSIYFVITFLSMNILKKIFLIIDYDGIQFINLSGIHKFKWEEFINYNIKYYDNYMIIGFQTKKSIERKNILLSKDALRISTMYLKLYDKDKLIEVINKYKKA
jgi:hypothetical protein